MKKFWQKTPIWGRLILAVILFIPLLIPFLGILYLIPFSVFILLLTNYLLKSKFNMAKKRIRFAILIGIFPFVFLSLILIFYGF